MQRIDLHWICETPTHYNDFLFNALADNIVGIFEVHYMVPSVKSHPWKVSLDRCYRSRAFERRLGVDWRLVQKALPSKSKAVFVIGGWFDVTAIITIIILFCTKRPFIIWTDTPVVGKRRNVLFLFFRNLWLRFVFRHAAVVMGTGKKALSVLERMGCPASKLVNLPYFTDTQCLTPRSARAARNELVFVSSGRLVLSVKGYDIAIKALGLVKRDKPSLRFKYRIAGIGPDLLPLKQLVQSEGLDECIEFVGWLDPAELNEFYKSGDIFLHPSRVEPYGVAIIEAMACGLVVIGSASAGAITDRIRHGENGYQHRPDDAQHLAATILEALSDPEKLVAIAWRARETAEQWPVNRGVQIVQQVISKCVAS